MICFFLQQKLMLLRNAVDERVGYISTCYRKIIQNHATIYGTSRRPTKVLKIKYCQFNLEFCISHKCLYIDSIRDLSGEQKCSRCYDLIQIRQKACHTRGFDLNVIILVPLRIMHNELPESVVVDVFVTQMILRYIIGHHMNINVWDFLNYYLFTDILS